MNQVTGFQDDAQVFGPAPLEYDETIEIAGVRIPFAPALITPKLERPLRSGRYRKALSKIVARFVRPGDRVLDLGAGTGVLAVQAHRAGASRVVCVDANPEVAPLLQEVLVLNGVTGSQVVTAVAAQQGGPDTTLYLREDFWASSATPEGRAHHATAQVPTCGLEELVNLHQPNVLIVDLDGAEATLFDASGLAGVHTVILNTAPRVYGYPGAVALMQALLARGFAPRPETGSGEALVMVRDPVVRRLPHNAQAMARPEKVTVVTCMKDEGPFILEWIAYHRSIGVTDFIVFSNDCSDGTDRLLDRLDQMGIITHLPNPATVLSSARLQPVALAYAAKMRGVRDTDVLISMDVDEFINIHVGQGTLSDLFEATGPFHALSISELNFSCNNRVAFEPGWLTEQFTEHQVRTPGKWKSHRGVKTILRAPSAFAKFRNHRSDHNPEIANQIIWLDGSGRPRPQLLEDAGSNGWDCRGSYDLVSLHHHALRSVESFLVKKNRGDVVVEGKSVQRRYFRVRNTGGDSSDTIAPHLPRARAEFDRLTSDPRLAELHETCVRRHREIIETVSRKPEFQEMKDWILSDCLSKDPETEA